MSHQRHAQHLFCDLGGFGRIARDLDTAAFSPAARVNLRFHHYASADFLGSGCGFFSGKRNLPAWHGDLVLGQDCLGLILMDFHGECLC